MSSIESDSLLRPIIQDVSSNLHILHDETGLIKYKGKACNLILTSQSLIVEDRSSPAVTVFDLSDIIGCSYSSGSTPETYKFTVYRYIFTTGLLFRNFKQRTAAHIELSFHRELGVCQNWANIVSAMTANPFISNQQQEQHHNHHKDSVVENTFLPPKKRKVLVFINPHSGSGTALSVWTKIAEPMFCEAGVEVHQILTTHAGHARDLVASMDRPELLGLTGIAGVGGDGIIFEITNGIAMRADAAEVFAAVPLLPIPGGTGNGLAKSLLYQCDEDYGASNAVFTALKGTPQPLDLSTVSQASGRQYVSFMSLAWVSCV